MSTPGNFDALGEALAGDSGTAIIFSRRDGRIGFWNAGAEALFGHAREDVVDRKVDVIVPEEYRTMHWAGFDRAMGSSWRGSEAWGPVEALHKDGRRIALEVFLTPVQDADGRTAGVLAFFRPSP